MFEKNIRAIQEKNPALAERLEKINIDSIEGITVAEAENEDLIIGYKGIALHSMVDPIREARAIWSRTVQSELKKNDIQVIFGLGLGYLFKRSYLNADSKIFLIEPFTELLRFVLQHVDLSAELSDERVYITDSVSDITDKIKEQYLQGDKAEFLFLPAYVSLAKDILEDLSERSMKIIEEKSSDINTIFKFAPLWTKNLIRNMPYFFNSITLGGLKDKFAGKTVLILAAGPGLAENIQKIKQNKDKFVTIAAGKVFKVLVENDIIPDFVTFADASRVNWQTDGVENALEKTNIILTSRTDHNAVLLNSKSKIIYLTKTDPFSGLFQKHSRIDPGIYDSASSVSIINYFIARALGFNNIIFCGLDLAFPDNKIYASGEELQTGKNGFILIKNIPTGRKIKYVKDRNGKDIATRDDYLIFIRQFEDILEEEVSFSRVINTSAKGAYIKGMDYIELDEITESLPEQKIDVDNIIEDTYSKTKDDWHDCVQNVFNQLYGQKIEIANIMEEAELINENIGQILENADNSDFNHSFLSDLANRLTVLRKRVMENIALSNSMQGELWDYTKNYKTEDLLNKDVIIENLKTEKTLLIKILNHSQSVLNYLENASINIEEKKALLKSAN